MSQEQTDRIASLEHLLAEARGERDALQQQFDEYIKRHALEHSAMETERVAAIAAAEEAGERKEEAIADAQRARLAVRQHFAVRQWLHAQVVRGMAAEEAEVLLSTINRIAVEASHGSISENS